MNKQNILRALKISLIVGVILNLINQGEVIFILDYEKINYYKFFLTFLVPFCVSLYTAVALNSKKDS